MTDKEYQLKRKVLARKARERKRKAELRKIKYSWLPKFKKPNTSKLIVFATFVICIQILWFSEHMASVTGDTSFMYALLGIPAALIPVVISYMHKSKCENLADSGFVYETRMKELNEQSQNTFIDEDEESVG